jgi:hypothetical protein
MGGRKVTTRAGNWEWVVLHMARKDAAATESRPKRIQEGIKTRKPKTH